MELEEAKKVLEEEVAKIRREHYSDVKDEKEADLKARTDVAGGLGMAFENGELTKKELEAFVDVLGFDVPKEFADASDEEAKKMLWKTDPKEAREDLSEGQVKDSMLDPNGPAVPSDKAAEADDAERDENGKFKKSSVPSGDDDDEKKRAMKFFGLEDYR